MKMNVMAFIMSAARLGEKIGRDRAILEELDRDIAAGERDQPGSSDSVFVRRAKCFARIERLEKRLAGVVELARREAGA